MNSRRAIIFDLPGCLKLDMLYEMEEHGMLDLVFVGAFESHIHNDQTLLMDLLDAYGENFVDCPGYSDRAVEILIEKMRDSIQEVVWSVKGYAEPIKVYEKSSKDRHVEVCEAQVRLEDDCFILWLEIDDDGGID